MPNSESEPFAVTTACRTATAEPVIPDITAIFREHVARVERTLLRLGVRESDVADATQEVFLVVHRKLHAFEGRASVSTWLYRIALRVAAAQRRLARHRRELCSDELTSAAVAGDDLQAELEKRALLSHFSEAFERLSEPQRAVLALHELEELRMHEVARRLGIPRKTAFSRVYAARRALAIELRRLGYATPMWLPLVPSPAPWLERMTGLAAGGGGNAGGRALTRAARLLWTQAKLPVGITLCAALLAPIQPARPHTPAARPLAVEAVSQLATAMRPQLPEAPHAPAFRPLAPQVARKLRQRAVHQPKDVPASVVTPPEPSQRAQPAAEFRIVRMGSEDVRPVVEHPFASRVRAPVAVLPPLTARFAPAVMEPTLPD